MEARRIGILVLFPVMNVIWICARLPAMINGERSSSIIK